MAEDYDVGYKKPPRHSQFLPGQSGFKGRKKHKAETKSQMIARVRDELVDVNGKTMTKFELAVRSAISQTVKSGKPKDLKALFDLLHEHGATPAAEMAMESKANAEKVIGSIMRAFSVHSGVDPEDADAIDLINDQEGKMVIGCAHCGPKLRANWSEPEYKALMKRHHSSHLHRVALGKNYTRGRNHRT